MLVVFLNHLGSVWDVVFGTALFPLSFCMWREGFQEKLDMWPGQPQTTSDESHCSADKRGRVKQFFILSVFYCNH